MTRRIRDGWASLALGLLAVTIVDGRPARAADAAGKTLTGIMPTHGLCRLSLGFSVLPRISLLASFERADIIWKSFT